jgi:hypothetical protein
MATSASAAIITGDTPVSQGETIDLGPVSFDLELDTGMSGTEINLLLDGGMGGSAVRFALETSAGMMDGWLMDYGENQTVDGSLSFSPTAYLVQDPLITESWALGQTAYAGFSFRVDATTTNYGWLELTLNDAGTNFEIVEWAYDDTGIPIETGYIPEPNPALLLGLALAGLASGAKKKSAQVSEG